MSYDDDANKTCGTCNGAGRVTCGTCNGSGQKECTRCGGKGYLNEDPSSKCPDCVAGKVSCVRMVKCPGVNCPFAY
jgi:hypothetical protein